MNNLGRGSDENKTDKSRIATRETLGILLALFTALILVVVLTDRIIFGTVGHAVRQFFLGVFGYGFFPVAAAGLYTAWVLVFDKKIGMSTRSKVFLTLACVFFTCLVHTITVALLDAVAYDGYGSYLSACYRTAGDSYFGPTGGGVLIGLIAYPVARLTTSVGGYIIFGILTVGSAYFFVRDLVSNRSERRRKRNAREEKNAGAVAAASQDTSNMFDLNYQADFSGAQGGSSPDAAQGPYVRVMQNNADRSRRLYSVGDEFEFKTKRELRQEARQAEQNPVNPAAYGTQTYAVYENPYAGGQGTPYENDPGGAGTAAPYGGNGPESAAGPSGNPYRDILYGDSATARKTTLPPYGGSGSGGQQILYPGYSNPEAQYARYTSNGIFDSDSYFNRTDRGRISSNQYAADNFGSSAKEADGKAASAASPAANAAASAGRAERKEETNGGSGPRSLQSERTIGDMYAGREVEDNITYSNIPKKIVTDRTAAQKSYGAPKKDAGREGAASAVNPYLADAAAPNPAAESAESEPAPAPEESAPGVSLSDLPPLRPAPREDIPAEPRGYGRDFPGVRDPEPESERTPEPEETGPRDVFDENPFEEERGGLRSVTPDLDSAVGLFDDDAAEDAESFSSGRGAGFGRGGENAEGDGLRGGVSERAPAEESVPAPSRRDRGESAKPKKRRHVYARYKAPREDLISEITDNYQDDPAEIERRRNQIVETLSVYKIPCEVVRVTRGPAITRYEIETPGNIQVSRVLSYDKELAIALKARDGVNMQPNYANGTISIEVPNDHRSTVGLREILESEKFRASKPGALTFAIGKDIEGNAVVGDIAKMKHLLVAGATGSGKSVFLHGILLSLIYKFSPEDLRIILIDPKQVEFTSYTNLPHLMINEVVYEPAKVINVLNWCINEMERRYSLFREKQLKGLPVREIDEFNQNLGPDDEKMPKIVIVIDEVADLMQAAKKEIEDRIQRLTQKSRAAGIHLILATQRPSVNVITGVIKTNLPTRVALKLTQEIDSRTILDSSGAEKLLGNGDLLYRTDAMNIAERVQGAYVPTAEIQRVLDYVKENNEAYFDDSVQAFIDNDRGGSGGFGGGGGDDDRVEAVYIEALRYVVEIGQASISMIQRRCSVGYPKAGKIIEWMENMGYISAFEGAKARKVLLSKEEFESKYGDYGA